MNLYDFLALFFLVAACWLAFAAVATVRRRPTVAQRQLAKVLEFPRREDRIEFRSRRIHK